MEHEKKVVIIGNAGSGKTHWCKRITQRNPGPYVPTHGLQVHQLVYKGMCYHLWDTAGNEKFAGLGQVYYIDADACIIFYDISSPNATKVREWTKRFREVCPDKPVVVVANMNRRKVKHRRQYGDVLINVKSNKQLFLPFDILEGNF